MFNCVRFSWWLFWFGVCLAALSLVGRARHELRPSPVEIVLEWSDTTRFSGAGRVPLARWLSAMRRAGAQGVVLDVQNVRDLSDDARLTLWPRAAASPFFPKVRTLSEAYRFVVVCRDSVLRARVRLALGEASRALAPVDLDEQSFAVALSPQTLATFPVGLDPLCLSQLKRAQLEPLARVSDFAGATPARLQSLFASLRRDGVRLVIAGDPAPGIETLLPETARLLRASGLVLAWVELETARGAPALAEQTRGWLVRAHAVSSPDTLRLEPGALEDRFARAARERNARLLLVRLPRQLSGRADEKGRFLGSGFDQSRDFIGAISRETRENGWAFTGRPTLSIGRARRFGTGVESPRRATLARLGAGVSVVAALMLVLGLFAPLQPRTKRKIAIGALLVVAALAPFPVAGAQITALAASLLFPVVALAWSGANTFGPRRRTRSALSANATARIETTRRGIVGHCLRVLVRATVMSFASGLVVAALLRDWMFASKVADFWGTKAASIGPVALVALLLLGEFWPGCDSSRGWVRVRRRLSVLGRRAFPLRDVLLGALCLGVVGLWLARSGNDSGVGVSDFEWRFRAALETLFVARPRTKEFLLCHPALVAGALLLASKRAPLGAWTLLLLGTIGQINVVNSFAQANNPLYVPLWRTLLSLALGGAFGWLVIWKSALALGWARDRTCPRGASSALRLATALGALSLMFFAARGLERRRRYAELVAPSEGTTWPWKGAQREHLRPGVEHFSTRLRDGTTLDLLAFDFGANPRLRLSLWDSDLESSPDKSRPRNRFAYWNNGLARQGEKINARGDVVALWNAGFWGLLNTKPRASDRAFHLSPVVVQGRAYYPGPNRRWTWGARARGGQTTFVMEHQPDKPTSERDFDFASGTLQALILDGKPLELRPYPWFGEEPEQPPIASTPREAGHIPTLDWMHTSRASAGWTGQKLWILLVKEPDGETPSRALVARRERGHGGWTLADTQRFWNSFGARNAVGFDGGDVLQSAWRSPNGEFSVLVPRLTLPPSQNATKRFKCDARFQAPSVRSLKGGALSYFVVREESEMKPSQAR